MRIFIFILFLFASSLLYAQKGGENPIDFRFVCGAGATTSASISECQRLVAAKSYVLLRSKLFSENLEEAVLAAIALKELARQQALDLLAEERAQISRIEVSDNPYSVCYTCTQRYEGTVKDIFRRRHNTAYSLIKFAIFKAE
jgi:hypothetical protein